MPYSLMIKANEHGGFQVEGPHEWSGNPGEITTTGPNATIMVFHPPPPGENKTMALDEGDKIRISAFGHLYFQTQKDPSVLRCTPEEWAKATAKGGGQTAGKSEWQ